MKKLFVWLVHLIGLLTGVLIFLFGIIIIIDDTFKTWGVFNEDDFSEAVGYLLGFGGFTIYIFYNFLTTSKEERLEAKRKMKEERLEAKRKMKEWNRWFLLP